MKQIEQTLTSMEVAEMVEKDHGKLLRDIRGYISQLAKANIGSGEFFNESTYKDQNNQSRPCYKVTKKGCEFIANKLTGIKGAAFTARFITRFHDMEESLKIPMTTSDQIKLLAQGNVELSDRVTKLEGTMNIDYGQQKVLNTLVHSIVINQLGGIESNAYKEIGHKVFKELGRDYNNYFNVNSRCNTPRIKFESAIEYVKNWKPSNNTELLIRDCNAQMSL